jgi:hypothetical protein
MCIEQWSLFNIRIVALILKYHFNTLQWKNEKLKR